MEITSFNRSGAETLVSLSSWVEQLGVTTCTVWRWRRKGWLKVVNICGRLYVSTRTIQEFMERAQRGDFAQEPKTPRRH